MRGKENRTVKLLSCFPPGYHSVSALQMSCPPRPAWQFEKETHVQILLKKPLFLLK